MSKHAPKLTLNKETVARLSLKTGIQTGASLGDTTTVMSRINGSGGPACGGCMGETKGPIQDPTKAPPPDLGLTPKH